MTKRYRQAADYAAELRQDVPVVSRNQEFPMPHDSEENVLVIPQDRQGECKSLADAFQTATIKHQCAVSRHRAAIDAGDDDQALLTFEQGKEADLVSNAAHVEFWRFIHSLFPDCTEETGWSYDGLDMVVRRKTSMLERLSELAGIQ